MFAVCGSATERDIARAHEERLRFIGNDPITPGRLETLCGEQLPSNPPRGKDKSTFSAVEAPEVRTPRLPVRF